MTLRFIELVKKNKARPGGRYTPCKEGGDQRLRDWIILLNEVDHALSLSMNAWG